MAVECKAINLPGVLLFSPNIFEDDRGFFMETFHSGRYAQHGITCAFVQDNYSHSCGGTLRGLHYQLKNPQAKLVSVIWGAVFDVAVDIRQGSPTFGQWAGHILSQENRRQLYIPAGFAHGFCVLSDQADVTYKCSSHYCREDDRGILWSDPEIGIDWPVRKPLLSGKDAANPTLAVAGPENLPVYSAQFGIAPG